MAKTDYDSRLFERCEVIHRLLSGFQGFYESASPGQQAFMETTIGAAIWYLPKPKSAWTGQMSERLLLDLHPDSGLQKVTVSEEHVIPRKHAARELLNAGIPAPDEIKFEFEARYCKVHYITSGENKKLQSLQRSSDFMATAATYDVIGIRLLGVDPQDLSQLRRRNAEAIERYVAPRP